MVVVARSERALEESCEGTIEDTMEVERTLGLEAMQAPLLEEEEGQRGQGNKRACLSYFVCR